MEQRNFKDSWLLPCSLRSHRIANPRPKMGFAILRLCPPTARQAGGIFQLNDCRKNVSLHFVKQSIGYSVILKNYKNE